MKFRTALVSNSSAASFTIYGWTQTDLENTSFAEKEYWEWNNCEKLRGAIFEIDPELKSWDFHVVRDKNDKLIVGFGQSGIEIDHGLNGWWEDFKFPEPSITQGKHYDEIAKKLNLPQPKIYQDTWFDG